MSRFVAFDVETAPGEQALARELVMVETAEKIRDELAGSNPPGTTRIQSLLDEAGIADRFKFGRRNKPEALLTFFTDQVNDYVQKATKRCSLDPLRGRIVSAAFFSNGMEVGIQSDVACIADADRGIESEADLLRWIWQIVALFDGIITFNGASFDIRYLQKRSAILGVTPTRDLSTRRYAYTPHCDVMQWLADWDRGQMVSLENACVAFGIPFSKGGMTGADVAEYVDDERWDEIKAYNLGDVADSLWLLYAKCRDHIPGHADERHIRDARLGAIKQQAERRAKGAA